MNDNRQSMFCYLEKRGVKDKDYLEILKAGVMEREYRLCQAEGTDFMFARLFDESDVPGYGLIRTNQSLHTDEGAQIAIGIVEGDDIVCMDVFNGTISLWLIENGDGERLKIADCFKQFWNMVM